MEHDEVWFLNLAMRDLEYSVNRKVWTETHSGEAWGIFGGAYAWIWNWIGQELFNAPR